MKKVNEATKLPLCPKGQRWCPVKEKCIPVDDEKHQGQQQQRGQGEGPMGKPTPSKRNPRGPMGRPRPGRGRVNEMDKIKEAEELVDVILKGDYDTHKKIQEADAVAEDVLDEVENKIDTVPDQDLADLHSDVVDELTKDEGVTPVEEKIAVSISRLIREEEYREFFKKMLKKHNVSNPSDLDDEKKKEFFNTIDREWKAKKESD